MVAAAPDAAVAVLDKETKLLTTLRLPVTVAPAVAVIAKAPVDASVVVPDELRLMLVNAVVVVVPKRLSSVIFFDTAVPEVSTTIKTSAPSGVV
jgi:hypothetical protein